MRSALAGLLRRRWKPLALALAVLALLAGNRGFRRLLSGWLELRRLEGELSALGQDEAGLRAAVARATSDEGALERSARSTLGFLRPGELEYRFPPPGGAPPAPGGAPSPPGGAAVPGGGASAPAEQR